VVFAWVYAPTSVALQGLVHVIHPDPVVSVLSIKPSVVIGANEITAVAPSG
jgi:hypothetical protein